MEKEEEREKEEANQLDLAKWNGSNVILAWRR